MGGDKGGELHGLVLLQRGFQAAYGGILLGLGSLKFKNRVFRLPNLSIQKAA